MFSLPILYLLLWFLGRFLINASWNFLISLVAKSTSLGIFVFPLLKVLAGREPNITLSVSCKVFFNAFASTLFNSITSLKLIFLIPFKSAGFNFSCILALFKISFTNGLISLGWDKTNFASCNLLTGWVILTTFPVSDAIRLVALYPAISANILPIASMSPALALFACDDNVLCNSFLADGSVTILIIPLAVCIGDNKPSMLRHTTLGTWFRVLKAVAPNPAVPIKIISLLVLCSTRFFNILLYISVSLFSNLLTYPKLKPLLLSPTDIVFKDFLISAIFLSLSSLTFLLNERGLSPLLKPKTSLFIIFFWNVFKSVLLSITFNLPSKVLTEDIFWDAAICNNCLSLYKFAMLWGVPWKISFCLAISIYLCLCCLFALSIAISLLLKFLSSLKLPSSITFPVLVSTTLGLNILALISCCVNPVGFDVVLGGV